MKAEIRSVTTRTLICPACGEAQWSWGHLPAGASWGPWYCNGCNASFRGQATDDGGTTIEPSSGPTETRVPIWVLLRARTWDGEPIYLIIHGHRYVDEAAASASSAYFYNEHTCPTNYLGVEAVIAHGDDDPHGVFEFVAYVDIPDGKDDDEDESMSFEKWRALFPQIDPTSGLEEHIDVLSKTIQGDEGGDK
jgi:hypothetical protein